MKINLELRRLVSDAIIAKKATADWYLFLEGHEPSDSLLEVVMDVLMEAGEMPYGVAKARTGDPYQWTSEWMVENL